MSTDTDHDPATGRRIAWIGLGEMGLPMSAHLAAAGHDVRGYDRDPARLAAAGDAGVRPAASSADAVAGADVVVTMLRTGAQTEELVLGPGGLADAAGGPLDVVVMSTMDPVSMRAMAAAAAQRGLTVLDVPVSGGVRGAEAATLSIMASGPADALERQLPWLTLLGAEVHRLGDEPGMSQAAKLANQVMMAVAIAGTFEALALAADYGVPAPGVIEAVSGGTGASWPLAHWEWMTSLWEQYEPDNALDILDKDLKAVMAAIGTRDVDLPVTAAVFERLTALWDAARASAAARAAAAAAGPGSGEDRGVSPR